MQETLATLEREAEKFVRDLQQQEEDQARAEAYSVRREIQLEMEAVYLVADGERQYFGNLLDYNW